jgi:protein-tyrosine phosphatase
MGNRTTKRKENLKKNTCEDCHKGIIENKMASVNINFCRDCYNIRKKQLFDYEMGFAGEGEMDEITNKLYLGNNYAAKSKNKLQEKGITHILVCGYFLHEFFPNDFIYKTIEIEDDENENIYDYIIECIEFIENAEKVLVHCRAGISRSSSIVISYVMYKKRMKYLDAKEFVFNRRDVISPNDGFEDQLKEFEQDLIVCDYNLSKIKDDIKKINLQNV